MRGNTDSLLNWPLTTGPDFDLLFLLIALAGDVHPTAGPPRYPCLISFKNVTSQCTSYMCSLHVRIGYIQDVLVSEIWRIIVESMTRSVPPVRRHHRNAHLRHRLVPPTHPPCQTTCVQHTSVEPQLHRQQTNGTKHLPRCAQCQSGCHSGVQAHGPIIPVQNYTLVRQDRHLGPVGGFFYYS